MRTILLALIHVLLLPATLRAGQVIFTEVMFHPQGAQPEFIEITNLTSNRCDMAKWTVSGGVDYTFPDFNSASQDAHILREYERILVSSADETTTRAAWPAIPPSVRIFGPWTGSLNNAGEAIVLQDAAGARHSTLEYGDNKDWPIAADGTGHSLHIINPNGNVDDWRNWRASLYRGGSPGTAEPVALTSPLTNPDKPDRTVVDFTSSWKYWRDAADPDGANPEGSWFATAFDDSTWSGPSPGFFGHDPSNATLQAARGTSFTTGYANTTVTYYFRTTFQWQGAATGQTFNLDQWIDDGVVYYLNGQELKGTNLGRVRMAVGATTHTTIATGAPPSADAVLEANILSGSLDGQLLTGTNVLCAEVHQNSAAGDDIYFGARLRITAPAPGGVMINEVKPAAVAGAGFVEFYNPTASPVNLAGYYLSDTETNLTKFQLGPVVVPAGGRAVVDYAGSMLSAATPVTVLLTAPDGYTRQSGFQSSMVADGRSAGRNPDGSATWVLLAQPTPGLTNAPEAWSTLALSEVNFAAATGRAEWIEIYNNGTAAQPLDGLFLTGDADFTAQVPLTGSVPAGGYLSFPVDFPTDASGGLRVFLANRWGHVVNAAEVQRRVGLFSLQAWPAGSKEWYATPASTQNAANNPERQTDVVINEIMAKPPSSHTNGEFIEFYNKGAAAVDLSGWEMADGIDWRFPAGTTLSPGAWLVLARDPAWLTARYPGLTNVQGPWSGTLRNSGEQLRLHDARGNLADLVDFRQGGQWPTGAGGEGSSLELMHPAMDNSQPSAWRASDESTKSTFQTFTHTGTYRELRGTGAGITNARELLLNMVGDGHVILKNIKLTKSTAPTVNIITTGDATSHNGSSATGFLCTGTHCESDTLPRAGATITGEPGFHLISRGGGDTKANKAEVDVTGIAAGNVLTLSFEGRWVYGLPLMIGQTWDRSFGNVFRFPIPENLGTPGAANSRAIPDPAPTVDHMAHFPVVPTASQPVTVTARVTSALPLASVTIQHRQDTLAGTGTWSSVAMNDGGTLGDAVAGDGLWSGIVPARANGAITQFYIKAAAANGQENDCPRNGINRPGMWIVSTAAPTTQPGLLIQRNIISLRDRNALNNSVGFSSTFDWDHPRMSNYGWNATMIFNESEVYYNCELRRGGSPWTRVITNSLERTRWKPPGDQLFRERTKSGIDSDASNSSGTGASRFHNRVVRYMLYLFGYPVPDSEFVLQIVNTDSARLADDMEQTDSDFFDRAYADGSDGELYEIDDSWFMYDTNFMDDRLDAGSVTGRWHLTDWSVGGPAYPSEESPIFFHGNWPLRFPEDRYDYSALSSMIKTSTNNGAAVTTANDGVYRERMERVLDIERAAIYAAVRGYVADWDNFTMGRGKNGYFYRRPGDGKFEFHHWDSDLAFQSGRTGDAILGSAGGVGWTNLQARPWFRQKFNYYMTRLISQNVTGANRMTAFLTAMNYQATNPSALAPFKTSAFNYQSSWFTSRNSAMQSQLGTNFTRTFTVSTSNGQTVTNPVFSLTGVASNRIERVEVVGHPEAIFSWSGLTDPGQWTLGNIRLASGLNTLTIRSLFPDGTVSTTQSFTVTLSGNAPPAAVLTTDPASGNVAAGEILTLDATGSFDPEGQGLTFAWSVSPAAGASLTQPGSSLATARFSVPGPYTVTLQVTDAAAQTVSLTKNLTVYNTAGFSSFGTPESLGPEYTLTNVALRSNYSPSTWYSLEDFTGRILLQILDGAALPMASPAFTHPLITRDLPDSAGFILQTRVVPDSREFGNWRAGLMAELTESGATVRYAFAIDGGLNLLVLRSAVPAAWTTVSTTALTGSGAVLRIVRSGTSLLFQRQAADAGAWTTLHTVTLPAGTLAGQGGIFAATSAATSVRTGFDYLIVADASAANSLLANLRITEVNYRPGAGGVEFIELRNIGTQSIDLTGAFFAEGQPFGMAGNPALPYTFGAEILAPGEFITLTDDPVTFRALYGPGPRLAPAWTNGSLSNSGERILLQDASGSPIHDFTYSPLAPWPVEANGTGSSMEVIAVNGDYTQGTNWRANSRPSPGAAPDQDGDGSPDEAEALFGTNPNAPGSAPSTTLMPNPDGTLTLSWPSIPGVVYIVQTCTPLSGWTILQTFTGTGTWTFSPTVGETRRFYRISAAAAAP